MCLHLLSSLYANSMLQKYMSAFILNIFNANPRKLIINYYKPLVSYIKSYEELVAVYITMFSHGWVHQALHILITIEKNSCIFLQVNGLIDDNCIGL